MISNAHSNVDMIMIRSKSVTLVMLPNHFYYLAPQVVKFWQQSVVLRPFMVGELRSGIQTMGIRHSIHTSESGEAEGYGRLRYKRAPFLRYLSRAGTFIVFRINILCTHCLSEGWFGPGGHRCARSSPVHTSPQRRCMPSGMGPQSNSLSLGPKFLINHGMVDV